MGLRLWSKSVKLAMRSRRRFIAFTLMYTVLMVWMTWNFQLFIYDNGDADVLLLVVSIVSTIILSILYAWIVINYRKNEIATLKCIGYKNSNIRTIIIGAIVTKNINVLEHWVRIIFGIKLWRSSVYMFEQIPNEVNYSAVWPIALIAIAGCCLGAFVPAIVAARTKPVEILRYE